ncbi:DUF4956 domain-containing protein [Candidatus Pseudothioglobus singularis]|jgi:hypothetical protein|nr:DUF4956 domain-containing protein [Candidatus Pseudothioglobus singularis]
MNNSLNIQALLNPNFTQIDLIPTLFSFLMCVIMSFILRDFYIRRSFSLSGKMHIGSIIPVLSTVVFLVIIVVKSSLALSLGLVGALSIVRFRTPIKEPEELVYLFLAIAIGLGYAAGQVLVTTIISLLILFIVYFWLSNRKNENTNEFNLVIKWNNEIMFEKIIEQITPIVQNLKLVRLDKGPLGNTSVLLVVPNGDISVEEISNAVQKLDRNVNVSFFEANTNW